MIEIVVVIFIQTITNSFDSEITFIWTSPDVLYRYEHAYTYKTKELQNILEIKLLCNCFAQLLLIY